MEDHGCLTLNMGLHGKGWECIYGGYCLGNGYIGAKKFNGSGKGLEYIMRIMDTVGVARMSDLEGKYVRVAIKSWDKSVKIIGNVIDDRWFNEDEFFKAETEK